MIYSTYIHSWYHRICIYMSVLQYSSYVYVYISLPIMSHDSWYRYICTANPIYIYTVYSQSHTNIHHLYAPLYHECIYVQPIPRGVGSHFRKLCHSSKLKAQRSLSTEIWQQSRSSSELCALKQHSKMSPQVGLAILPIPFYRMIGYIANPYTANPTWGDISIESFYRMVYREMCMYIYVRIMCISFSRYIILYMYVATHIYSDTCRYL